MAPSDSGAFISDPFLLSILQISAATRTQAIDLADLVASRSQLTSAPVLPDPNSATPSRDLSNALQVCSAQKTLYAYLAHLRSLNRQLAHVLRDTKSFTSTSRAEIDRLHLSLQNLYYEQRHLTGEIAACESYPHKYTSLPLMPLSEFLEQFGGWEQWKDKGEEELMKARIEHEGEERQKIEERRLELGRRKLELAKENAERKEELSRLDRDLETFIDAAKPIQQTFDRDS